MARNIDDIEADLKRAQNDYSYLEADSLKEFERLRTDRFMRISKLISERNRYWYEYEKERMRIIEREHS